MKVLMDLATLAHLHVSRAHTPLQSNVIEASVDQMAGESEKEWHVSMADKSSSGPHSFEEVSSHPSRSNSKTNWRFFSFSFRR